MTRLIHFSLNTAIALSLFLIPCAAMGQSEVLANVRVTERGLHAVTAFDLANAGVDLSGISLDELAVTHLGQPQAVAVQDLDSNGQYNAADRLIFFGQPMRGETTHRYRYAQENTYQIVRGSDARPGPDATRSAALGPIPASLIQEMSSPELVQGSLQRRLHFEEDRFWSGRFAQHEREASDFTFAAQLDFLRHPSYESGFSLPGLDTAAEAPATVVVDLYGRSDAGRRHSRDTSDHMLEVQVNGHALGTVEWNGTRPHRAVFENVPVSSLQPAGNTLTLALVEREEVEIDVVLFDWFEVMYPVRPAVEDNAGEFALLGSTAGTRVELTGLTSPDATVMSLTNQQVVETESTTDFFGGAVLTFEAPVDNGLYALATNGRLLRPAAVEAFDPGIARTPAEGSEFLIITHPLFREQAERLAAHRREHDGLSVVVADIDDIYDHFNHGIPHPNAIKRGLAHAHESWPAPDLRYVLLMGDASWDWHGIAEPSPTFIPTNYVHSHQVEYSSENEFVMNDNHEVFLALGRLPVGTVEEAEGAVDKLIAYDEALDAQGDEPWRHGIVFAASDNPMYRNFLDTAVETHVEGNFDLTRLYASNDSPLDCTQRLIDTINEGTAFVSYVGHGARYVWQTGTTLARRSADYEANFNPDRIDELVNGAMLPIVFGITCFTNNFDNPNPRDCIGEKLVLSPEGGAIASIATSSYSYVHSDMRFCDLLFETLFNERPERVGDLFFGALTGTGNEREIRRMFILLGDPTARIPLVPLPEAQQPEIAG